MFVEHTSNIVTLMVISYAGLFEGNTMDTLSWFILFFSGYSQNIFQTHEIPVWNRVNILQKYISEKTLFNPKCCTILNVQ